MAKKSSIIKNWNRERGFGFVEINGKRAFLHASALEPRQSRGVDLTDHEVVVVETERDPKGLRVTSALTAEEYNRQEEKARLRNKLEDELESLQTELRAKLEELAPAGPFLPRMSVSGTDIKIKKPDPPKVEIFSTSLEAGVHARYSQTFEITISDETSSASTTLVVDKEYNGGWEHGQGSFTVVISNFEQDLLAAAESGTISARVFFNTNGCGFEDNDRPSAVFALPVAGGFVVAGAVVALRIDILLPSGLGMDTWAERPPFTVVVFDARRPEKPALVDIPPEMRAEAERAAQFARLIKSRILSSVQVEHRIEEHCGAHSHRSWGESGDGFRPAGSSHQWGWHKKKVTDVLFSGGTWKVLDGHVSLESARESVASSLSYTERQDQEVLLSSLLK